MPVDPNIALSIKPVPSVDPLSMISQLSALKSNQAAVALRNSQIQQSNAQTADIQAQADQRNKDIADQNTLEAAVQADPSVAKAIGSGNLPDALVGQLQPKTVAAVQAAGLTRAQGQAALDADTLKNNAAHHAQIEQTLTGVLQDPNDPTKTADDATVASRWPASVGQLVADGHLKPGTFPDSVSGADQVKNLLVQNGLFTGYNTQAQAIKAKAQEIATAQAAAAKDTAQGSEATSAAALSDFKLNLMKGMNSGSVSSSVDNLIDPAKYPKANADAKAAATLAMSTGDPAKVSEAVQGIYNEQVGSVQKADALIPGEVSKAVKIAQGTIGTHEAEDNYRNALQQGDKASADYFSSLKDAKQAVATANTIQTVIDLSKQTGNPVAMQQLKAMIPEFTNAAQNIKRLSGGQNAGLSSSLDNAINEITSAGGKPLSDETIKAISPYVKTIANGAVAQHNANVQALSKTYPQKQFAPEPVPYGQVGSHFVGESVPLKSGKTVRITKILPNDQFEYE